MNVLPRQKHNLILTSCILMLFLSAILMSCGKKPTYEGGHISLSYDTNKWELSYVDTEPEITFNLKSDNDFIIIMMIESDAAIVDNFHNDMVNMLQANWNVTEKGKTDHWDSQSWCYYEDWVESEEPETMIIYAKDMKNGKILVGFTEISSLESGEENTTSVNEALDIFNSMKYSEKEEIGDIAQDEEANFFVEYIYNNLNVILRYETADSDDDNEEATGEKQSDSKAETYISDEDFSKLKYIEKIIMEDFDGNETDYCVYAPIGNDGCDEGLVFYYGNGLSYTAILYDNMGANSYLYASLEENVNSTVRFWNDTDYGYEDIQVGEIQKNGNDIYQIISAQKEDYYGTPYEIKRISYMDVLDTGVGILWDLEIYEDSMDSESPLIIEELAKCYNIDPDELQVSGEWAVNDSERAINQQDEYKPADGENVLEKVDGYQYLGITTLSEHYYNEDIECPVMIPMGWRTYVSDEEATSFVHGVSVLGGLSSLKSANTLIDGEFKFMMENEDGFYRNVRKGDTITLPEYNNDAYYAVLTYEMKHGSSSDFTPEANLICFIRLSEEHFLRIEVNLTPEQYDTSTNALLKELEAAYGFDLSEYYYK